MSRKDKSLPDKVKQFFGKKEAVQLNFDKLRKDPYHLSPETLKDVSAESSMSQRLKCLKDLYEIVLTKKLEENALEALCLNIEDMLDGQNSIENRHIVFQFYTALINGQEEYMYIMRSYLFRLLMQQHKIQEDTSPRLEMLKALTDSGKNISYFEEEIGPFLLLWFPDVMNTDKSASFLSLVANVIKFNAAYIDESTIAGYVEYVSVICNRSFVEEDFEECLNILDAILCYSHLPDSVLMRFIFALCVTVNLEKFSQCCWKQMRNLLGTNVGHTCIFYLCLILQDRKNHVNAGLLRGAIFFIGMALWGSNKVPALISPPTTVVPSFLMALEKTDIVIAYEVILSLQRLVKSEDKLQILCWDAIFDIIEKILEYPELQEGNEQPIMSNALHDLITESEEKISPESKERLYKIVDQCSHGRSDQSLIRLINYTVENMHPFNKEFLDQFHKILEKYFKNEKRSNVQLEALKVANKVRQDEIVTLLFENELIDQIILQHMSQLDSVSDVHVRKAAVELLIDIGHSCEGNLLDDILVIIEKIMKRMFDNLSNNLVDVGAAPEPFTDVLVAVKGLIDIFKRKLLIIYHHHCLPIYSHLASHLKHHYSQPSYVSEVVMIRRLILEFFLDFRANNKKELGVYTDGTLEFSVYVVSDSGFPKEGSGSVPSSPAPNSTVVLGAPTTSFLSYGEAFSTIITCLKEEKDWTILEMVFRKLPQLLTNKALIVRGNCNISTLCSALCLLVSDRHRELPDTLKNTPPRLTRTDIQGYIYPCVSALTSYHFQMESRIQHLLIRCLQSGLVSRSAKLCIDGLMLCALEMQSSMVKLLPDVLLKLSKISATVTVAVSVLEFLSNLIRLSPLYVSFVEDQYMSIFAIALPYTNPFKFNQYIVALAHHVIAMWFLKCRIPFRKDFAKFIIKGLSSNIHIPREECESSSNPPDDSSAGGDAKSGKISTSAIKALHIELMETGLDLMSRFTFGMSSNVPKKSPVSEFLLENGQKTSWLVGNKIVTITTSSCSTKSFKNGLCERCYNMCEEFNKNNDVFEEKSSQDETFSREQPPKYRLERKRHRSAIQGKTTSSSKDALSDSRRTKDDILVHFRRLQSLDSAVRRDEDEPLTLEEEERRINTPDNSLSFTKSNKESEDKQGHLCNCWCTNWAEVHIRRPTGNTSWIMKIQNQLGLPSAPPDVPLSLLTSMVLQGPWGQGPDSSLLFPMHEDILESEIYEEEIIEGAVDIVPCPKTDPPLRRTNSSPDVNTVWTELDSTSFDHPEHDDNLHVAEKKHSTPLARAESEQIEPRQRIPSQEEKKPTMRLDFSYNKGESSRFGSGQVFVQKGFDSSDKLKKAGSFRDRGHTISVMSPVRPTDAESSNQKAEANRRSGMNPSFVFLQLYHNCTFGPTANKPLLISQTEANNRALNVLDHIPPYDTHKIGVVYVGPGQVTDEVAILSNVYGSPRYASFLKAMGNFVRLTDVDPHSTYLGGLDTRGEDGKFALIWHDDVMQVVFHVATFMMNKDNDPNRNEKKKHIANDSVVIVYNESGEDYNLGTIKGHVTNACVIIKPGDFKSNVVSVQLKTKELSQMFDHPESYSVSDDSLPVFVRQLALHANFASLIISRQQQTMKYSHVSNWLERLRTIKRLRSKVVDELKNAADGFESITDTYDYDNFTDYV